MPQQSKTTSKDIAAYLTRQSKETLVALLMEQAKQDDRLYQQLLMKAARKGAKQLDLTAFRSAIINAVVPDDFVHYREMWDYTSNIEGVIHSIKELLKEGYASEVMALAEYALEEVERARGSVDDSDGMMGGLLHQLQELHHDACKRAKPDPEELAKQLFAREMESDDETFLGAAEIYADVLGKPGLAKYRALAEAEWARLPALKPGEQEDYSSKRFRITNLMESLARQSGDIEALVAIKSRNLTLAYHYLQIAEIYRAAKQYNQALEWAERGLQAFPERTDSRLRDFLAEEYHRRQRHDEALQMIWAQFSESPHSHLSLYQKLKQHTDRIKQWPQWRARALHFVHEKLSQARSAASRQQWGWARGADFSELVSIFIWENDPEAAWQAAQEGGCSADLWVQLAALREKDYPEDALEIYQRQIEPLINQKNNPAYEQATQYVSKVRELMQRLGRAAEFAVYLEGLRKAHKPKRNFMALLDRMK